jgi:hypothetical protein
MIKMLTVHTSELDEADAAVNDILGQLDIKNKLLKNSAGLLFCYVDFIKFGIVEAICRALPFDVVGCTTQGIVIHGAAEVNMLALAVLTSDDIEFFAGVSEPLDRDVEGRVDGIYRQVSARLKAPPSLIFTCHPVMHNLAGDVVTEILSRASGGRPVFGTVALDVTTESRNPMTIHNGTAYTDRLALLLLSPASAGDTLKPQFSIDSTHNQKFHSQTALVTGADNTRIISIDNIPAAAYLERIGLIQNGAAKLLFAFPVTVDYHDGGEPRICVVYSVEPDGSLICGSSITRGSTLQIGTSTSENVLISASHIIGKVRAGQNRNGLLLVSCFSRNVVLSDPREEMELVQKQMEDSPLPYIFLYAAGEPCPEYDEAGGLCNRYHQHSITSCIF